MDTLREKVSGKKQRFKHEGYNLDLSYVTKRIIAMSFPGEGLAGFYRNPIDQVSQLLKQLHDNHYFVFNLCGKKYNYTKFHMVLDEFGWEDHHSPPLDTLFRVCRQIHNFLKGDIDNVVVIHCLAGKGRTGTVICCYLLYTGKFKSVEDVLYYYGKKRFLVDGLGVNQPCQLRYIYYFYEVLTGKSRIYPAVVELKSIRLTGKPPDFNFGGGCKPYFQVFKYKNGAMVHQRDVQLNHGERPAEIQQLESTNQQQQIKEEKYNSQTTAKVQSFKKGSLHDLRVTKSVFLAGDILINFFNQGMMSNEKMFRFAFNTAFLDQTVQTPMEKNYVLIYPLDELDPNQVAKDPRFDPKFKVIVELGSCSRPECNNQTPFDKKCEPCSGQFMANEIESWRVIYEILNQYQMPSEEQQIQLLFKDKKDDDVEAVMLTRHQTADNEAIEHRIKSSTLTIPLDKLQDQQQS